MHAGDARRHIMVGAGAVRGRPVQGRDDGPRAGGAREGGRLPDDLSPDSFTLQTSILFQLIVLFGGLGTLAGPLVGAMALVLLLELLHQFLGDRVLAAPLLRVAREPGSGRVAGRSAAEGRPGRVQRDSAVVEAYRGTA
jgi:hypothetical protein